jgi:hypothetical protein
MLPAMSILPAIPDVPSDQRALADGPLRYQDVSQDGRLLLTALPHFMGQTVFQSLLVKSAASRQHAHAGILPIMSRLLIEVGPGPVSIRKEVTTQGGFEVAHTVDENGAVNRLLLDMWATMTAPASRTNGPRPANAGEPVDVGRVYGEHVFTRPFAPAGARKVTHFEDGPWPAVPAARRVWRTPEAILALPDGASWLEEDFAPDEAPYVFGLGHTDSNQHVNSLVYPRLLEDAALRRLARLGRSALVLGRSVEIGYRKPCFAGQKVRIFLRGYVRAGVSGVVGFFRPDDDLSARPHAVGRMELE